MFHAFPHCALPSQDLVELLSQYLPLLASLVIPLSFDTVQGATRTLVAASLSRS